VAYLAVVVVVSLTSPRRILPQSERRCWDEWCLNVEHIARTASTDRSGVIESDTVLYVVDVRVSNIGKARAQRENGVVLYLLDSAGRRYDPDLQSQRALAASGGAGDPMDTKVAPGVSFVHRVAFRVPRNAVALGLVKEGQGPQAFIIDDDQSLLHKRTMTRFDLVDSAK
jgi:hypothetical protein